MVFVAINNCDLMTAIIYISNNISVKERSRLISLALTHKISRPMHCVSRHYLSILTVLLQVCISRHVLAQFHPGGKETGNKKVNLILGND